MAAEAKCTVEERSARIFWAIHILSYLSKLGSLPEGQESKHKNHEENKGDLSIDDIATTRATMMQGLEHSSLSKKFLDCIAQLFSPDKGWSYVTATALREHEDFIEIDIARNDCFGVNKISSDPQTSGFQLEERSYCDHLRSYLATSADPEPLNDFEHISVQYNKRRVYYWVQCLKETLEPMLSLVSNPEFQFPIHFDSGNDDKPDHRNFLVKDILSRFRSLPKPNSWHGLVNLLARENGVNILGTYLLANRAYECFMTINKSVELQLDSIFGASKGAIITKQLRFLARPIIDCRIIRRIAIHYPQFRNVKIIAVPPRPEIRIDEVYRIKISEAWSRLKKVGKHKPEVVWLDCLDVEDELGRSHRILHTNIYLGLGDLPFCKSIPVDINPIRNRRLGLRNSDWEPLKVGYTIEIGLGSREDSITGPVVNQSFLASLGESGATLDRVYGPLIAIRKNADAKFEDVTLSDFRHILDSFVGSTSTYTPESPTNPADRKVTNIRGVKICCYGEQKIQGSEEFVSVEVPITHPARRGLQNSGVCTSNLSEILGLPVRLWKYQDANSLINIPEWDEDDLKPTSNQNAASLMIDTNLKSMGWGQIPLYWNQDLGNVLVVRDDDEDLDIENIKVMSYFAKQVVSRIFEDTSRMGLKNNEAVRKELMKLITRENMVKCGYDSPVWPKGTAWDISTILKGLIKIWVTTMVVYKLYKKLIA
ncbi:hypothetical protein H072_10781 [Dactylellina haptotyla CBS 200.50]|uniref:Uncharacterized protein n=1 Tax=Dactylellina haptotyla (strain CBS 200.50) TaxID=1284197 RepID=S8BKF5_DACHA|nr:hypothetical protein H072_10781 [Dactylellina haptotyla CBS 200.50]